MITLRNKLYESLLDDEEDLINRTDDIDFTIDNLKDKGIKFVKKTSNKISIEGLVSNSQKSRYKDLDKAFFEGWLGNNFSYIEDLEIYGSIHSNPGEELYPKIPINIKEVDRLNTSLLDVSMLEKFSGKFNIEKAGYVYINCSDSDEKCGKYINDILPKNISQVFLASKTICVLKTLKDKNIDSIRVSADDLGMETGNKNILPKASALLINDLKKRNNIKTVIISFFKFKTVETEPGIKQTKRTFKLVPYKNSYKLG